MLPRGLPEPTGPKERRRARKAAAQQRLAAQLDRDGLLVDGAAQLLAPARPERAAPAPAVEVVRLLRVNRPRLGRA